MPKRRILLFLAAAATSLLAGPWTVASAGAAQTVTVAPASPIVGNCLPFGDGSGWGPYMGWIYKNVPAFQLNLGDTIAFDTAAVITHDVQLEIDLAPTTTNGGTSPVLPFFPVVLNTQTPINAMGDTTVGNFEMRFTAQGSFNFPGGGLIIRFSSPSASYQLEGSCTQNLVHADSTDPSGNFVERFFGDADGVAPWTGEESFAIGGFQLTLGPNSPTNSDTTGQMIPTTTGRRAAALASCKKRAKKHHWSHRRLKRCERKANLLPL